MSGPVAGDVDHRPDVSGVVLQIAVEGDDEGSASVSEAGGKRRRLPEIAAKTDHPQAGIGRLQLGQQRETSRRCCHRLSR